MNISIKRWIGILLSVILLVVVIIIYNKEVSVAINKLSPAWLLAISMLLSIAASLIASFLFDKVTKEVWRDDVNSIEASLVEIKADLGMMSSKHESVMVTLPEALGGGFTKSLLGYYPHSSSAIATILGDQMWSIYRRHYRRVIVLEGQDTYRVNGLFNHVSDRDETSQVWETEFDVKWTWKNDSKVTKSPLTDLMVVIAAPQEALENFNSSKGESDNQIQDKYFAYFLDTENYIRSTVLDPYDASRPLSAKELKKLFGVNGIKVTVDGMSREFKGDDLIEVHDLPTGIYHGVKIKEVPVEWRQLAVHESMQVEYLGRMKLPARALGSGFTGEIVFPPSDIVGEKFELALVYPIEMEIAGKTYALSIENEGSGCKYLHEPFESKPIEDSNATYLPRHLRPRKEHGEVASIVRIEKKPLTEMHVVAIRWGAQLA